MNNTASLYYKLWLETRLRFLITLGLTAFLCLLYVMMEPRLHAGLLQTVPGADTYAKYVYLRLFTTLPRFIFQCCCLLLGLGGLQRDRKQGTLGFTLALPVSRPRQVLTRALFGMAQVAAIAFASMLLVWTASNLLGHAYPIGTPLLFAVLWTTGGGITFALSFLCSVVISSEYTALAVAYVVYLFALAAARLPRLRPYPLHVTDVMNGRAGQVLNGYTLLWNGHTPVHLVAGYLAAALLFFAASTLITQRQDL